MSMSSQKIIVYGDDSHANRWQELGLIAERVLQGIKLGGPEAMPTDEKSWEELAKNTLRAAMMQRGVSYAELAERLEAIGVQDNDLNLRNKVSRGRFTAVFLMQCLKALEAEWIHVPASLEEAARKGGAQALARKVAEQSPTHGSEKRENG